MVRVKGSTENLVNRQRAGCAGGCRSTDDQVGGEHHPLVDVRPPCDLGEPSLGAPAIQFGERLVDRGCSGEGEVVVTDEGLLVLHMDAVGG